jgi:hypothetical protein
MINLLPLIESRESSTFSSILTLSIKNEDVWEKHMKRHPSVLTRHDNGTGGQVGVRVYRPISIIKCIYIIGNEA